MKNKLKAILFLWSVFSTLCANPIDSLEQRLRLGQQVQEKIYIHTDNRSYFLGDTLWYKAYVLRADDLRPTDMSKILYVELLTPDGYLVERQRVVIDHETQSYGQFALPDSLYSGYYELRAYTRWQLNFNVTEREHGAEEDLWFYNSKMAKDYFRDYEGLYSRVFPIFEKPTEPADYADKKIVERPRRRALAVENGLNVQFYPEGGQMVKGLDNWVAYEVTDADGRPLSLEGQLSDGRKVKSDVDGRGRFIVQTKGDQPLTLSFNYQEKTCSYPLPKALDKGAVIHYDSEHKSATVTWRGVKIGAVAVTCRGKLVRFDRPEEHWKMNVRSLPTGVNEIVAYDPAGFPLAVRQLFVNHHDWGVPVTAELQYEEKTTGKESRAAKAYERVTLKTRLEGHHPTALSVSVHDRLGEELTYDDGNVMTDLLLAGDLRGFVAHPTYYFEADDNEHRQRLDLLMMIQGWRKYAPVDSVRYLPERHLSVEGQIYKLPMEERGHFELDDLVPDHQMNSAWCFTMDKQGEITSLTHSDTEVQVENGILADEDYNLWKFGNPLEANAQKKIAAREAKALDGTRQKNFYDHKEKSFKDMEVLVEAELVKGDDIVGSVAQVDDSGRFSFFMPPFYDQAFLFMTAYARKDSADCCLESATDKYKLDPFVAPQYYVRQNRFYPRFSQPYSWRQTHSPQEEEVKKKLEEEVLTGLKSKDKVLRNVTVKARRRRILRPFDKNFPAFTKDFVQLLNDATDDGLHSGYYNSILFWMEAAHELFGNMNKSQENIGVQAMVDGHTFFKSYSVPVGEGVGANMTGKELERLIDPRRIWKVRVYTDYDQRQGRGWEENRKVSDVRFELIPVPGGKRTVRRDRRILLDGFAYPEQFYHRDYSGQTPRDSSDYRRTLYWNPNARVDADGKLQVKFYNGARPAYLRVSMCGISEEGKIYYTED